MVKGFDKSSWPDIITQMTTTASVAENPIPECVYRGVVSSEWGYPRREDTPFLIFALRLSLILPKYFPSLIFDKWRHVH
jgi:hypothetical protein